MDIQAAVMEAIETWALFEPGEEIVLGVSGGADSLCLLHILHNLPAPWTPRIHVAHLHHGLRGADADADASFVAQTAAAWGLTCHLGAADVTQEARQAHLSLEEAGRRARYTFLGDVAHAVGARTVGVAHNADDQVETILMHFLRGSGLSGLRGMLPLHVLPRPPWGRAVVDGVLPAAAPPAALRLVRPLLGVTRADIEAYCDFHDLAPRRDQSNLDLSFFRNRLRHELLPLLETYNPAVREALLRSARVLTDEHQALRQMLADLWPQVVVDAGPDAVTLSLTAWRALHVAWQRSLLREAMHRLRPGLRDIGFEHVESARQLLARPTCAAGDRMTLPRGLALMVSYDTFTLADEQAPPAERLGPQLPLSPLALTAPGRTALPDSAWSVMAALFPRSELPADWAQQGSRWRAFLDADAVGPMPHLRVRQAGDLFAPLGLHGRRSRLHAFMINHKLPAALRPRWPLLIGAQGIAWVCGLRIADWARVQPETRRVLSLEWQQSDQ